VQSRDHLIQLIQQNGAEYYPDLDRTTTHLVAKMPSGRKYEGAASRGVVVVAEEWLLDSVKRGMTLDELLYDPKLEPAKRGLNAWNRNYPKKKFVIGKRTRQEEQPDQGGRRKIRRTLSTKLSGAHNAIWADIKSRPIEKQSSNEWQIGSQVNDVEKPTRETYSSSNQQGGNDSALTITSKASKGLFSGLTIFIHGFSDSKV
jgi:DNA replication regulator DPB11